MQVPFLTDYQNIYILMMQSEKVIEKKNKQISKGNILSLIEVIPENLKLTFSVIMIDSTVFTQAGNEAAMSITWTSATKEVLRHTITASK